jgi:hypothetical protein
MAETDMRAFTMHWRALLEMWAREAQRRAAVTSIAGGRPAPSAFDVIDRALEVLKRCGPTAYAQERDTTVDVLTHACCLAVKNAFIRRWTR